MRALRKKMTRRSNNVLKDSSDGHNSALFNPTDSEIVNESNFNLREHTENDRNVHSSMADRYGSRYDS